MIRLLLILGVLICTSAFAQTTGRVLFVPDPEESPGSDPIRLDIVQALAFHGTSGDWELYLLSTAVPEEELSQALLPDQMLARRLAAEQLSYARIGVLPADASFSGSVQEKQYGYLGSGSLIGGRIENGRLRGHLFGVSSFRGRGLVDVALDALIIPPAQAPALPSDGGEPWRALLRFREAMVNADEAGVRAGSSAAIRQEIPTGAEFRSFIAEERERFPITEPLEQGWSTAIDARLVLLDTSGDAPARVLVDLALEDDQWRIQGLSYRRGDRPLLPPKPIELRAPLAAPVGALGPGECRSTALNLDGFRLQPSHAVAIPVPDQPRRYWVLLSEGPLPKAQIDAFVAARSPAPFVVDGRAAVILLLLTVDSGQWAQVRIDETLVPRSFGRGDLQFTSDFIGRESAALLDGVLYGHLSNDEDSVRFAVSLPSGTR